MKKAKDLSLPLEGFARLDQVLHAFGIRKTTLYERIKQGKMPAPIKGDLRMNRWPVAVIRECLAKEGGSVIDPEKYIKER